MCVLLCPTNDLVSSYGDILRLAKEVACKVLNPRWWSAQDREDAAHDAAADLYLNGVPGLPWREEVERELRVSIQGFRRCEGKTRKFNYHYKDIGGLDRAIANQSVYRITTSEVVEGGLQRENEISLCRALLEDPRTSAAVKPVCLLATVTQVEPKLVTEAMIDDALDASRPSRNEGILRSRASFLELFAPALNDLALAMELNPSCKQWPSHTRKIAWIFRGRDGEPCPVEGINDNTTQVGWLYQQRCRGENRLKQAAEVLSLQNAA